MGTQIAIKRRGGESTFIGLRWEQLDGELQRYLMRRLHNSHTARDVAQEVYLRLLRFEQLAEQRFDETCDLLVCSDVMHYIPTPELLRGLSGFAEIGHGLAFMDLFARGDAFVGDREEFQPRTAAWYRKVFAKNGWYSCGSHCYLSRELLPRASQLELAGT